MTRHFFFPYAHTYALSYLQVPKIFVAVEFFFDNAKKLIAFSATQKLDLLNAKSSFGLEQNLWDHHNIKIHGWA